MFRYMNRNKRHFTGHVWFLIAEVQLRTSDYLPIIEQDQMSYYNIAQSGRMATTKKTYTENGARIFVFILKCQSI